MRENAPKLGVYFGDAVDKMQNAKSLKTLRAALAEASVSDYISTDEDQELQDLFDDLKQQF